MNISVKIRFFAVWNVGITVVIKKFWISVRNRDSKRQMSALRGSTGTRIPVMKDEMAEFIAHWEKEVPGMES